MIRREELILTLLHVTSAKLRARPYTHPNSDFVQRGKLCRKVMTEMDREHLIGNTVAHLCNANKDIQLRQARIFRKAGPEYGQRVAQSLGIPL
ncbi:TPA: hypothetical protein HA273_01670 [Candidatus Bathyarchaeota archaeon]|nr:hypothetical protein [Candidatus Bathyarchaeota archaeon]